MRAIADCRFADTPPCLRLAFGVSRRTLNVNRFRAGWALPTKTVAAESLPPEPLLPVGSAHPTETTATAIRIFIPWSIVVFNLQSAI